MNNERLLRLLRHASAKTAVLALMALAVVSCSDLPVMGAGETSGALVPKTVAEDPSLPSIKLNGSTFHLKTFGAPGKPVIIFLHGGPGSDYRALLRLKERYNGYSLADDYFLVFWDQRGAGLSQRHNGNELTLALYKEDIRQLIRHFSPSQPVLLVGHSWGGMYATALINDAPELARGAVLFEPGPLTGELFESIKNDYVDLNFFAEWLNDYAWSLQFFSADDHARADYQICLGVKSAQPAYHYNANDPMPFWRIGALAAKYIPKDGANDKGVAIYDFTRNRLNTFVPNVLFVASALNTVLGEQFQEKQRSAYPHSELKVVAGAGHDLVWQKPLECVGLIRQYVSDLR